MKRRPCLVSHLGAPALLRPGPTSGQADERLTSKCQTLNCLTYLALSAQGHAQEE